MVHRLTIITVIVSLVSASGRADESDAHRAALRAGVAEIAAPGVPGPLVVYGDTAFVVVAGAAERGIWAPVVAAATCGTGRVAVFGHTGFGDAESLAIADTGTLMANAIRWVAGPESLDKPHVGLFNAALAEVLKQHEFTAKVLSTESKWSAALADLDVLIIPQRKFSRDEVVALQKFISGGGGVIACGLGWGWLQLNPGKTLDDHPLNQVLADCGIRIADGTLDRTSKLGFSCSAPISPYCHAARAVDAISNLDRIRIAQDALRQAAWSASAAVRALPDDDSFLRPRLRKLVREKSNEPAPSEKQPIRIEDAMSRLLLTLQIEDMRRLPPDKVGEHIAAREFPGAVPNDAKIVQRELRIDTRMPDWHSTGLYAAPGALIRVHASEDAARGKLRIRIGAHKDELWHKESWSRVPEITLETALVAPATEIASPFGGPIYMVVPENCKAGEVALTVHGAVEMPHFVLGRTAIADWRSAIRGRPAPWGELETKKVILTLPSSVLRDLDDPESLMRFWDRILDAHATLATIPLERTRAERLVADVQISAGYMHSGYPIMTHLDVDRAFIDLEQLQRGEKIWGFVHELGHNHQAGDWTFDGTGEVTCNLFSLYAIDTVCKPPAGKRGHEAVDQPPDVAAFIARGAPFDEWKREPFLALQMYIQLQREFGWPTFQRVFAEYRQLEPRDRPKSDQEKRDQWMVRFSRACGRNLGPFFEAWGVPTTEAARTSIAELPVWMPPEIAK